MIWELFCFKGIAVGAFLFGGIGLVGANLNFVQGAVVLRVAVILALGYGAFDRGVGVLTSRIVFHEKNILSGFLPLGIVSMHAFVKIIR